MKGTTAVIGEPAPGESWQQAMDSGELLLVAAVGMLVVAAVAQTAAAGLVQPRIALAFGALIALGEVLRLSLEGGRESATIGSAGAFAYAVVLTVGGKPALRPALQVIAGSPRAWCWARCRTWRRAGRPGWPGWRPG